MVRTGALASFILVVAACSPEVDDPTNFTAGNSQGNSAGTSSGGGGDNTEGATSVADGSASATTNSSADTTAGVDTMPPADGTTTGAPVGNCGNGVIDAGEQCDGGNLQGFDCQSLGLNGGTLACDDTMCTFDTSMCSSTTGGTSG
jgi:hypothetical protein